MRRCHTRKHEDSRARCMLPPLLGEGRVGGAFPRSSFSEQIESSLRSIWCWPWICLLDHRLTGVETVIAILINNLVFGVQPFLERPLPGIVGEQHDTGPTLP